MDYLRINLIFCCQRRIDSIFICLITDFLRFNAVFCCLSDCI